MSAINQIYSLINQAINQAWGSSPVGTINAQNLIAMGDYLRNDADATQKDVLTGALSDVIGRNIFVTRPLTNNSDLGIATDAVEFGAIVRKIRVKPKQVENNPEYDLTGAGQEAYDPFEITVPTVDQKLFAKDGTYMSKVTITDQQLYTAFTSEADLMAFYDLIYQQLEDSMKRAQWAWDRLALANFIAEKFNLQTTQATKTHTINVLDLFKVANPASTLTAATCTRDPEFLRFFAGVIDKYKGYIAEDTDVFNASTGYPSQTPDSRLNFYLLRDIDSNLKNALYANTYHDEWVKVNNFKTVSYWQGINDADGPAFEPASTSSINITLASDGATTVNKSGILAVFTDYDAVKTFYRHEKAESFRVPMQGTNHWKAITKMMTNDMFENGIVFYVEDTAA